MIGDVIGNVTRDLVEGEAAAEVEQEPRPGGRDARYKGRDVET